MEHGNSISSNLIYFLASLCLVKYKYCYMVSVHKINKFTVYIWLVLPLHFGMQMNTCKFGTPLWNLVLTTNLNDLLPPPGRQDPIELDKQLDLLHCVYFNTSKQLEL
jgi:hypothetical protein